MQITKWFLKMKNNNWQHKQPVKKIKGDLKKRKNMVQKQCTEISCPINFDMNIFKTRFILFN